jgi:two-component system sensor histidine kinase MprB
VSLRWRIASALAAITLVATAAIGVASYRASRAALYESVDESIAQVVSELRRGRDGRLPRRGPLSGFEAQLLAPGGVVVETTFDAPAPVSGTAADLVGRTGVTAVETVEVDGRAYRVQTIGTEVGAVQVARPLDEAERVLHQLRNRTILITAAVAAAAALVGLWLAGRVTASLRRLTAAAEHVGTTGRLDTPVVDEHGGATSRDEVGRLTSAFDGMLTALARSQEQQRRLVQDAGHELRTPLTSLRTNIDTLRRHPDLGATDRAAIVADLHAETEQLTDLVDEIVTVASGDVVDEPWGSADLVELATEVAVRAERRSGRQVVVEGSAAPVVAQRAAVQRAISCLIDNAIKFDTGSEPIEVTVGGTTVTVADRGPGIPDHELPLVFDRFHRAESARSAPGSGLGLAIVREVARRHGGDAFAANREGGGAAVGFRLGGPAA